MDPASTPPARLPRIRVYLDLSLDGRPLGRIYITLWPDSFPEGVENLIGLIRGSTYYRQPVTDEPSPTSLAPPPVRYESRPRTLVGSRFHQIVWNEYLLGGDIYQGRGTMAATIWADRPFPPPSTGTQYAHDQPYLVSLVPRRDPETGELSYDSTLMITLSAATEDTLLSSLVEDQVAIGQVTGGAVYLEEINTRSRPLANRRPAEVRITGAGLA